MTTDTIDLTPIYPHTTPSCMNKSEVYSWRLDSDLKRRLEDAARTEGSSLSKLLERIARDWLGGKRAAENDEAWQRSLHAEVDKVIGTISLGEGPYTRERIRQRVRANLEDRRKRHAPPGPD